jgi:hypothetical protein
MLIFSTLGIALLVYLVVIGIILKGAKVSQKSDEALDSMFGEEQQELPNNPVDTKNELTNQKIRF